VVQSTGVPFWQAPPRHASPIVHASPSSHAAPSDLVGFEHMPVVGSHAPTSWQLSIAVQTTGLEPLHVPAWHVSVCVHPSPSSHAAPSAFAGFEHMPVDGLHVPAWWHWSGAGQIVGLPAVQTPAWHVSPCVHASPSEHVVPSGTGMIVHLPETGSHGLTSLH
jgi:hypothetical protein